MSSAEVAHNGATNLIETLLGLGVTAVFGYPGGAILPITQRSSTTTISISFEVKFSV